MEKINNYFSKCPIIFKNYQVEKKIGEGAFSPVYSGKSISDNKSVAMKIEPINIKKSTLESEANILKLIKGFGIPKIISYGVNDRIGFRILIEPLFGNSLLYMSNTRRLSIEEICVIAIQVLERIEHIHNHDFIYRDIKPDNFVIGNPDKNVIYIIDFGLSKKYRSSKTKKHIPFTHTRKFTGTLIYASVNALKGGEQSRKDDLISIGYMIIYFMKKKLPWESIKTKDEEKKHAEIYWMKKLIKTEDLCISLPKQMIEYMNYVQQLNFEEEPNYKKMKDFFRSILEDKKCSPETLIFSWIKQSDMPKIKKYVNTSSRQSSPQQRLFKKIIENIKERERSQSSGSQESHSCGKAESKVINNPNINIKRNNSNFTLDIFNSKNNIDLLKVNFDKSINSKLLEGFDSKNIELSGQFSLFDILKEKKSADNNKIKFNNHNNKQNENNDNKNLIEVNNNNIKKENNSEQILNCGNTNKNMNLDKESNKSKNSKRIEEPKYQENNKQNNKTNKLLNENKIKKNIKLDTGNINNIISENESKKILMNENHKHEERKKIIMNEKKTQIKEKPKNTVNIIFNNVKTTIEHRTQII